jgi:SAM-dependent methyltransferase
MTLIAANHWPSSKCAKAFWSQQHAGPYRELLVDTLDWAAPGPGEQWLDLGCGGGALTRGLWERSGGALASALGVDCAAANGDLYARFGKVLVPPPGDQIRFLCHDFSSGLEPLANDTFDHAVSGLSISYAEHYDAVAGQWTTAAYDRLLAEVFRVLRCGGRFVFSVNVPEPSWSIIALRGLPALIGSGRPLRHLKNGWRMLKYGRWLKREARTGRFHYLPAPVVTAKLEAAGFHRVEHRLSYAGQAFVFRAHKPAPAPFRGVPCEAASSLSPGRGA